MKSGFSDEYFAPLKVAEGFSEKVAGIKIFLVKNSGEFWLCREQFLSAFKNFVDFFCPVIS